MPKLQKPTCDECFWFDGAHKRLKSVEENHGYCRKELPVHRQVEHEFFGTWPIVEKDDYCGGFTLGEAGYLPW